MIEPEPLFQAIVSSVRTKDIAPMSVIRGRPLRPSEGCPREQNFKYL